MAGDGYAREASALSPGEIASSAMTLLDVVDPVRVLDLAPTGVSSADKIDLTNAATIPSELEKKTARYVHLFVDGKSTWIDLGSPRNDAAMTAIADHILLPGGAVRPEFTPTTWFTSKGTEIVCGVEIPVSGLDGGVETPERTLQSSNERSNVRGDAKDDPIGVKMDALWAFVNGGSQELYADGEKDGSWYNGIELDGKPVLRQSPKDDRTEPAPPSFSLDEYRAMLVRDFDYNGAITEFRGAGGLRVFTDALLARFPEGDKARLTIVAREVWSYATTGMDTRGVTNIAEMQGYLYAFDPKIQISSDANTKKDGEFNAGTREKPVMLPLGDGRHGRSTILTTRHLLANVKFDTLKPSVIQTRPEVLFEERDQFVHDRSESMLPVWNTVRNGVDEALGLGSFDPAGGKPSVSSNVRGTFTHSILDANPSVSNPNINPTSHHLSSFGQLLEDAFVRLYPAQSRADALEFAKLFKYTGRLRDIFTEAGGQYTLNGPALMGVLGDNGSRSTGAVGESSLKQILMSLLYDPAVTTPVNGTMPRLNSVADEAEQSLEYLELAKALSTKLGVDVRILAVPTRPTSFNAATDIAYVPLTSMSVRPAGTGYELVYDVTQGGVTQSGKTTPIQYGQRGTGRLDPDKPFDRAWAPLISGQVAEADTQ